MPNNSTKNKNKNLVLKFIIIFLSIVVVYSGLAFAGVYFYYKLNPEPIYDPSKQISSVMTQAEIDERNSDAIKDNGMLANIFVPPVRTNFLLVGVDKQGGLTDSIMVGSYVSTTNEINIMSIPRDTFVEFEGDSLKRLRKNTPNAPSTMKINAVNVYGKDEGIDMLEDKIEELLGINIDYYVKVNLDAFKEIVDTVGGIDFDVPADLYYSDPTQNLYINLKKGYQHLNGEQAEGLVRFRKGYAQQDLQRVQVQQAFIEEFIKQALSKDNIKNNIASYISTYLEHVDTSFTINDSPKYIKCLQTLTTDNINSATLPGYAQMINGGSYYICDPVETQEIVDKFFYGSTSSEETTEETTATEASSEE